MTAGTRFLADEDFDNRIVRAVIRRRPDIDIVRVPDVLSPGSDDPTVLEWAAEAERVVLTHDVSTMKRHAYQRVADGKKMPGLFAVPQVAGFPEIIEGILLIADCSLPGEWEGQVRHLPL